MSQVIVDQIVTRLQAVDGALSRETVRSIVEAVLPAVQEMLEHGRRVERERSVDNGYLHHIESGGES
jgi:nucleoid DNA-binding protein